MSHQDQVVPSDCLVVERVSLSFGGLKAADGLDFTIKTGELVGMIGPNGAGKTTAIKLVTGVHRPSSGRVLLRGENITGYPVHIRARRGLAHTHQIVRPFKGMSVVDNVAVAAGLRYTANPVAALCSANRKPERNRALSLLRRVRLHSIADRDCSALPLGQLKRLEMARALALEPSLLLLDEPLAGLNTSEAAAMTETIREINGDGVTVLIVEHNLGEVMRLARRMLVLIAGRIVADGEPLDIVNSDIVRDAYLGRDRPTQDSHA